MQISLAKFLIRKNTLINQAHIIFVGLADDDKWQLQLIDSPKMISYS